MSAAQGFTRNIHLLYVPTLCCNLSCSYCYLGEQTTQAALAKDAGRACATLRTALARLSDAGVLAFNVSLHGGEVTTLPAPILDELFGMVRAHYLQHFDAISALGHKKAAPHIKTNLYKFANLYELFDRHKVSVSASIDLPLAMHARHRTTRSPVGCAMRTRNGALAQACRFVLGTVEWCARRTLLFAHLLGKLGWVRIAHADRCIGSRVPVCVGDR